jgi:copper transport protein
VRRWLVALLVPLLVPLLLVALLVPLLVPLLLVAASAPALAHAALLETDPEDGLVLAAPPSSVTLRFSEPVGTSLGAVRVIDPAGTRVDDGRPIRSDGGRRVTVALPEASAQGTYVLTWRVVSEDAHPVSGVSTFSVGRQTEPAAAVEPGGDGPAKRWLTAARGLGYAGLLLLIGATSLLLLVWPQGRHHGIVRRLVGAAWAVATASAAADLLLQGPTAAGLGPSSAFDAELLSAVLDTQYGQAHLARLGLLVLAGVGLVALLRSRRPPGRGERTAAGLIAAPLLLTWPLSGHAAAGELAWVATPVDALHLLAVGAWTGGLALLVVGLLRHGSEEELARSLPRWSRLATAAVVLMVLTGLFAAWREVRGLDPLTGTTYGQLLVVKTTAVVLMLGIGNAGRHWVRQRYTTPVVHAATATATAERAAPTPPQLGQLRRSVLAETCIALLVVAVTAVLVETPPARTAYAAPLSTIKELGPESRVQIDLDSARVGVNGLHVYLTGPGGKAFDVPEVTARLSRPGGESLTMPVPRKSLGHYETFRLAVPYRGTWRLDVTVRTSDIDVETASVTTTFR